jgi:hypothetical protein
MKSFGIHAFIAVVLLAPPAVRTERSDGNPGSTNRRVEFTGPSPRESQGPIQRDESGAECNSLSQVCSRGGEYALAYTLLTCRKRAAVVNET